MLWYLLSPLRGTTQPPRLSPSHPVRRAFYRHGKTTSQHWLMAMLVTVAIAMGFSYPTIFLAENPTAGLAAYPHHAWTTVRPIANGSAAVDIELRQIWVHGSYMNALSKDVLKRGLAVQQRLVGHEALGDTMHSLDDKLRSSAVPWAFHSPLMYWNNSAELIDADQNILSTINDQKHSSSSLDVALRPASVFAGKEFDRNKLRAADALVITLMNKGGGAMGDRWHDKMQTLADGACPGCTLFPADGNVTRNRVYEFSFTPLSISAHLALTVAYSAMAIYVLLSFRRLRAFHSRGGLVVTAITQMTCSILSSFTICHILKINLSTIPQNAYPFVVLVLGVENIFRLINAVLAYSPTMATELRIANALGDIGPVSVAAAAQNLTVLALLSTVVSPGVAAFCAFAAIATLFDSFFLLTFFVAVLSVDIRRLELQDAIAARHHKSRREKQSRATPHHTWMDALFQGRLPFSTRMAGTAVTATFVLSLNYHFFERKGAGATIRDVLNLMKSGSGPLTEDTFAPPPMNASLTPTEWMRLQDFDTAKEVMRLAKPGADSFVICLFAPLIVVLGGSDRTAVGSQAWTDTLRSFAVHHFYPVIVAIIFTVAFVMLLMNFLLYNAGDEDHDLALEPMEDTLTCDTVVLPHRLDIVKMATSDTGHVITVALDRTIAVTVVDTTQQSYRTFALPAHVLQQISWPIRHLAIDDAGEWIACHCSDDRILVYNLTHGSIMSNVTPYPDDHGARVFTFVSLPSSDGMKLHLLVLTSGGRLAMSCLETGLSQGNDLSHLPLMGAAIVDTLQGRQLYIVGMEAHIKAYTWTGSNWAVTNTAQLQIETETGHLGAHLTEQVDIQSYRDLDTELIVVTTSASAIFLDSLTLAPIAKFDFETGEKDGKRGLASRECVGVRSGGKLLMGSSRLCSACGSLALRRAAIASDRPDREDVCIVRTWSINRKDDDDDDDDDDDGEPCICLAQRSASCHAFSPENYDTYSVPSPGVWSTTAKDQVIIGLRKRPLQGGAPGKTDTYASSNGREATPSQLRQRRRDLRQRAAQLDAGEDQVWEAYKLSIDGDLQILELPPPETDALYVHNAGPVHPLDCQSVVVAFGNCIKVIRSARRATGVSSRSSTITTTASTAAAAAAAATATTTSALLYNR